MLVGHAKKHDEECAKEVERLVKEGESTYT